MVPATPPPSEPEFPKFSNLPVEIRVKIWQIVLEWPRFVEIDWHTCRKGPGEFEGHKICSKNIPPLLSTCSESRGETIRFYELATKNRIASPLWINYDADVVCILSHDYIFRLLDMIWIYRTNILTGLLMSALNRILMGYSFLEWGSEADKAAIERVRSLAIPICDFEEDVERVGFWAISYLCQMLIGREGFKGLRDFFVLFEPSPKTIGAGRHKREIKKGGFFCKKGSVFKSEEYLSQRNIWGYGNRWNYWEVNPFKVDHFRAAAQRQVRRQNQHPQCKLRLLYVTTTKAYQQQLDMKEQAKLSTRLKKRSRAALDRVKSVGEKAIDQGTSYVNRKLPVAKKIGLKSRTAKSPE